MDKLEERLREYLDPGATLSGTPMVPVHQDTIRAVVDKITRLKGEVERLMRALADLRTWAAVLHQNSVGCAENHHGADLERFGMPGWLDDAGASISRATDLLARSSGKAGSDA